MPWALLCRKCTQLPGSPHESRVWSAPAWGGSSPAQPAGVLWQTQTLPDDSHTQSINVSVLPEDSFPGELGLVFSVLSLTQNLELKVEKHAGEITSHRIHSWSLTCQIKYLG